MRLECLRGVVSGLRRLGSWGGVEGEVEREKRRGSGGEGRRALLG